MIAFPFNTSELVRLCRQHDIVKAGIFGSMVRGESDDASDIDLLVEFSADKSLLGMIAIERHFSDVIGRKVEVLTETDISPYLRDRIRKEALTIYEA